ncbi:rhamnulokinase family protein [Clostridium carnis]
MGIFLAFDFGASSGRAIISKIINNKVVLDEIHRFPNEPVFLGDKYVWDFPRLLNEMKIALRKAALLNEEIEGIGIDTWGVDYGLLDKDNNLIGMTMHYRDKRNYNGVEETKKIISLEELFLRTGISPNTFNTCFQLASDKIMRPDILKNSDSLLFMPDLFAYYLTGEKKNEFTISSTSGLLNMKERSWDYELIEKLDINKDIFNEIIEPGEIYGYLTEDIMEETGLGKIPVIAVGSHDTASAVAATPILNKNYAFLSSGTWSLLGIELDSPIINKKTFNYGFTNEGGVSNKIRLLKNINGLWLIQQLKKTWCELKEEIDFPDIIREARKNENCKFIVDTNDESLMNTKNMIKSIKEYCIKHGQGEPKSLGELAMAVYNGLTNEYSEAIREIEDVLGYKIEGINIVGGGIKDSYLCELTSKRTAKKVIAGPVEAAVLGNMILQWISVKKILSVEEGRNIILNSFKTECYL